MNSIFKPEPFDSLPVITAKAAIRGELNINLNTDTLIKGLIEDRNEWVINLMSLHEIINDVLFVHQKTGGNYNSEFDETIRMLRAYYSDSLLLLNDKT